MATTYRRYTSQRFSWANFWHAILLVLALGMIVLTMVGCIRDPKIECAIPTEWCPLIYPNLTPSIAPTRSRVPVYQIDTDLAIWGRLA